MLFEVLMAGVFVFLAHGHFHSQDPKSWSPKVGVCTQLPWRPARKGKTALYLFVCFYFQLNELLTFNSKVLIFLAWLLNSGNPRLPVPGEPPCAVCLKYGSGMQKLKWDLPFSAKTRQFLMFCISLLNTNPSPYLSPPKTMQMTHVNCLGLVANIPNASEEMWPLWVPNFALKGHGQMSAINVLALKLVCYPCPEYPVLRQLH